MALPRYLIDSHSHLDFARLAPVLSSALDEARTAGIRQWIVPGTTRQASAQQRAVVDKHTGLFAALGLHPYFIAEHTPADLEWLRRGVMEAPAQSLVAVGECGLDAMLSGELYWDWQLELCEAQLALAKACDLPVILHVRKAHQELFRLLKKASLPRAGVIHAYTGSYQQASAYVDLGFCLGAGGAITYERASKTRDTFSRLPVEHILLETDAPDMPVQGFQGQVNLPVRMLDTLNVLAQLRGQSAEALGQQLTENTRRLFRLPIAADIKE
ncbi:TatD family hydrolase [Pokkaliibacter sp. CJK22405]|uniref:TatD family hydrolase n=1 Tax=Pokkaliibacter sp. CJK22405 TaxID=3384615 RepID=UPI003984D5CF